MYLYFILCFVNFMFKFRFFLFVVRLFRIIFFVKIINEGKGYFINYLCGVGCVVFLLKCNGVFVIVVNWFKI